MVVWIFLLSTENRKNMTGTILGTWLGGNELYKEGLIIRATALKWTEQFYLACEAWKKFLWVKSHLSAGKTSFLTLCQCSPRH